jgi:hypothetical protein
MYNHLLYSDGALVHRLPALGVSLAFLAALLDTAAAFGQLTFLVSEEGRTDHRVLPAGGCRSS